MARKFYVVMQKRWDGGLYADLHKTDGRIYESKEEAEEAQRKSSVSPFVHVVPLVALTLEEWESAPCYDNSEG